MDNTWTVRFFRCLFAGFTATAFLAAPIVAGDAAAALLAGYYQLDYDKTVDKTEAGTTDVTKLKQIVEVKYSGFFSPVVANAFLIRVEQEVNSDAPDLIRWQPQIDLGLKGKFWSGTAGAKRLNESSDETGKSPKTTDNYFVELFYLPPKSVPDLKAKYTLDVDFEEGVTDTSKHGLTLSSVYVPNSWLAFKGDYTKNTLEDRVKVDADTDEDKISGSVALKYIMTDKIKYDTQFLAELSQGATLKSDGSGDVPGTTKEDTTQTWKNALSFRPFSNTGLDGTYDYDLKKNKISGEQTLTLNSKAVLTQQILTIYAARGEFSRNVTEARNTADDNEKTEDTWTAELKAKFSKQLDFSFKYQDKSTTEVHDDPSKNKTLGSENVNATWNGDLTPFWKASASWDRTLTYDWVPILLEEKEISDETKYSLKTTFLFKGINLTLDPSYDVSAKDTYSYDASGNRSNTVTSDIQDFKFKFAYLLVGTRTIEAKLDHTYGKKWETQVDAGRKKKPITRTDNTNGNVVWKALPGWIFGFDLTRNATDTSEDDLEPDITTTLGVKADCAAQQFAFSTSFKYDIKTVGDNSANFDAKAGWKAPKWDTTLTYNYKKTFSAAIDEGYSIIFTFKYNL